MNLKTPIIALLLASILILAGCSTTNNTNNTNNNETPILVGGDSDSHGCKASAGYTWCGALDECIRPWETNCSAATLPDTSTTYITRDPEQCKVVKYMCVQGKEPFSDSTGCGCRPTTQTVEPTKTFCKPEQRNAEICTMEYHQVCGWFNESVKCLRYPCAIEAANPCDSCANPNVDYYTEGACPTGLEQTAPALTSSQLLEQINSQKACTMDYTPVCALFDDGQSVTMGNACSASNVKGIVSTTPGECASASTQSAGKRVVLDCDQNYIDQQNKSVAACTREYVPVCASDASGVSKTFDNKCGACTTKGITQYAEGACNDGTSVIV